MLEEWRDALTGRRGECECVMDDNLKETYTWSPRRDLFPSLPLWAMILWRRSKMWRMATPRPIYSWRSQNKSFFSCEWLRIIGRCPVITLSSSSCEWPPVWCIVMFPMERVLSLVLDMLLIILRDVLIQDESGEGEGPKAIIVASSSISSSTLSRLSYQSFGALSPSDTSLEMLASIRELYRGPSCLEVSPALVAS